MVRLVSMFLNHSDLTFIDDITVILCFSWWRQDMFFAWGDGINSPHLWNPKGFPSSHNTFQKYLNENTALHCLIQQIAVIKTVHVILGYTLFQIWAWNCGYCERMQSIVGQRNLTISQKWWILFVLSIFVKFHSEPNCLCWWTTSLSGCCYVYFSKHNYFSLTLIVVNNYKFWGLF